MSASVDLPQCDRCEERVHPVSLEKLPLIGRLTGKVQVETIVRTVRLHGIRQRLSPMGAYERPSFTRTDVTLCDQCWGAFLSWVNEPGQERAKIAAANRRADRRLLEVAERRRDEQVRRHMAEAVDSHVLDDIEGA